MAAAGARTSLPADVALVLRRRGDHAKAYRESQAVELVWTGPLSAARRCAGPIRRCCEVITSAQQSLLIVSFAVYKIPAIASAIVQAAKRGVTIRICVEAPEPSGQKMAYDTIKALGPEVAQRAASMSGRATSGPTMPTATPACCMPSVRLPMASSSFSQAPI